MLCLLSYGHHAHPDSTSEKARSKTGRVRDPRSLEPFSKRMNLSEKRAISNQPKQNRTLRADRVFKEGHPL